MAGSQAGAAAALPLPRRCHQRCHLPVSPSASPPRGHSLGFVGLPPPRAVPMGLSLTAPSPISLSPISPCPISPCPASPAHGGLWAHVTPRQAPAVPPPAPAWPQNSWHGAAGGRWGPPHNPSFTPKMPPAPLCSHQDPSLRHHRGQTSPQPHQGTPADPQAPCSPPPRPAETGAARDSGAQALHQPARGAAWAEHRLPRAGSGPLPGPNSEKYSGASNSSRCLRENFQQPPSFAFYRAEERLLLR